MMGLLKQISIYDFATAIGNRGDAKTKVFIKELQDNPEYKPHFMSSFSSKVLDLLVQETIGKEEKRFMGVPYKEVTVDGVRSFEACFVSVNRNTFMQTYGNVFQLLLSPEVPKLTIHSLDGYYSIADFVIEFSPVEKEKVKDLWRKFIYDLNNPVEITSNNVASPEIMESYNRLLDSKAKLESLKDSIDDDTEIIKMFMGDSESLYTEGGMLIASLKQVSPTFVFDSKSFKDKYPDLYKSFLKEKKSFKQFRLY